MFERGPTKMITWKESMKWIRCWLLETPVCSKCKDRVMESDNAVAEHIGLEPIKVSIIMPVYNMEKYLLPMLGSIKEQTLKDFECLCIDDGSADSSLKILKEFASNDSRFKIFQPGHGGCMAARNYGLDHAKGRYVYICDSDDMLYPHTLECLVWWVEKENADALRGQIRHVSEDMINIVDYDGNWKKARSFVSEEPLMDFLLNKVPFQNSIPGIPGTLFKREALLDVRYESAETPVFEDGRFWLSVLCKHIKKCVWVDVPVYKWRQREGSMSHDISSTKICLSVLCGMKNAWTLANDPKFGLESRQVTWVASWLSNLLIGPLKPVFRDFKDGHCMMNEVKSLVNAINAAEKSGFFSLAHLNFTKRMRIASKMNQLRKIVAANE